MPDNLPLQHGFSARRLVPLGLLVAAGVAFMAAGGRHYVTFAALAEHRGWLCRLVARWGVAAALLYIVAYACLVALSVPGGAVLTIAGGFLFGTWLGGMCAVIGATLGATALFLAARAGLGGLGLRRAGPLFGRLEAGFRADAFSYLLVAAPGAAVPVLAGQSGAGAGSGLACRLTCSPPLSALSRQPSSMPASATGFASVVEKPDLSDPVPARRAAPDPGLGRARAAFRCGTGAGAAKGPHDPPSRPRSVRRSAPARAGSRSPPARRSSAPRWCWSSADAMGGDCLNFGCVPSKSLLAAARLADLWRRAPAIRHRLRAAASRFRRGRRQRRAGDRGRSRRTIRQSGSRGSASPCCAPRRGSPARARSEPARSRSGRAGS